MIESAGKILQVTRAKDWRLSFVPFIIGCVYLWLWWFKITLTGSSLLLFVLSFITTFGFAALGYFINEFFDKAADARAGKANRLAVLPYAYQAVLFAACLAVTFLPWLWLPKNNYTFVLLGAELLLFLFYSLPFPRLKAVPLISGFIDSGYAYVLPLVLSFYTYSLFAGSANLQMIYWLAAAVFFIGFRNITIHHVNDIFKDMRSRTRTLPQLLGVTATNYLLLVLFAQEILLIVIWSVLVALQQPLFWAWLLIYFIALVLRWRFIAGQFQFNFISIEPVRHLTDPVYQYVFPAFTLLLAVTVDYKWLVLVPFHIALLLTKPMRTIAAEVIYWRSVSFKYAAIRTFTAIIIVPTGAAVNYTIYFLFRAFGVNLRQQNESALSFIKKKLNLK